MANADNTPVPPPTANDSGQRLYQVHSFKETPKERRARLAIWRTSPPVPRKAGKFKAERFVTVTLCPGEYPAMPWLRLRGQWLVQAGFEVAMRVRIHVEPGRLTLTPETAAAP
jgi:hypothetical protein